MISMFCPIDEDAIKLARTGEDEQIILEGCFLPPAW